MKPLTSTPAHELIRASAGSGKTFQLTNRYLELALSGHAVDRILAATFARKAAGEIFERIVIRLALAARDDAGARQLSRELGRPLARSECLGVLADLVERLHRVRVGTLDSFFAQLTAGFGLELGLPPGWRIVDDIDETRLQNQAVAELLGEGTPDLLTMVRLIARGDAERSVAQRIVETVEKHYAAFLESDRDAWHALPRLPLVKPELLERLVADLSNCDEAIFGHGSVVKMHAKSAESACDGDWSAFIGGGIPSALLEGKPTYYGKPISAEVRLLYEPLVEHALAHVRDEVANQTEATWQMLSRFDEVYRRVKRAARAMRFDDVARALRDGFNERRIGPTTHRLDAQLAHLLLDEFQDTSLLQWSVVRPIARSLADVAGQSLFFVGDEKQAIYGWRGGVAEVFGAVQDEIAGIAERPLDKSFRSSQPVIDVVNRVFQGLPRNPVLADYPAVAAKWAARFRPHSTYKGELAGYCRLEAALRAADGVTQAAATLTYAAEQIARLARELPGRTIGVLVRTNDAVAKLIYELRSRHGLMASEEGGSSLVDSPAVQLVLAALTLADHPGDTAARFHLATSPLATLMGVTSHDDDQAAKRAATRLRAALIDEGYGRTIYAWSRALAADCGPRDARRLAQLVELAHDYDARATLRADDFCELVEAHKVADPGASNVRVMTVHQAKGLEFDAVVLPELFKALRGQAPTLVVDRERPTAPIRRACRHVKKELHYAFPDEYRRMFECCGEPVVDEALSVLYVALTRAVYANYLIVPPANENEKKIPSTFAGLLRATLAGERPAAPGTVLFEHGDADWAVRGGATPAAESAEPIPATENITLKESAGAGRRGLARQSPSRPTGQVVTDLRRRFRGADETGFTRGTLWHKWFEQIDWLNDGPPSQERLIAVGRALAGAHLDLSAELAAFYKAIGAPAIAQVLSRGYYADAQVAVFRERRIAVRLDDMLLSGTIDRLVLIGPADAPSAADVIDFKTDAARSDVEIEALIAYYRPQLEAYRRAVEKQLGLPPGRTTARIVLSDAGVVRAL